MIRALIGGFILHCIDKAERRRARRQLRPIDISKLSDRQISDLVHGRLNRRRIDTSRLPPDILHRGTAR